MLKEIRFKRCPCHFGRVFVKRALDVALQEINNKTDVKIEVESIQRAKHRRVEAVTFAIEEQEPPQSQIAMAGGLNHLERKWNPSSLLEMKNFAPVLLVLSVLSTMAVPQNARFVSSGNTLSEAYRTILYVPPKSPTQDFLRFLDRAPYLTGR
jgi:hypothetical protein